MRRTLRLLKIAPVVTALSACASLNTKNDQGVHVYAVNEGVATRYAAAKSCCASMAEFNYKTLTLPAAIVTHIDDTGPAYDFPTGKSYFLAYRLPSSPQGFTLTISSYFAGHVFFPNFLFLDSQLRPVRHIGAPDTHYVPPSTWVRGHYELTTSVKAEDAARYLVILTTEADMKRRHEEGNSSMLMPAGKIFVPVSTGPFANEHGPTGKIKLVAKPLSP